MFSVTESWSGARGCAPAGAAANKASAETIALLTA
jgi:hypothetical protein